METAAYLLEHPEIEHGPIRICFTCDEEIGHGVDHVDLERARRSGLLHARRPGGRRNRRGNIFGRPGHRDRSRRERASGDRQGADGQRRARGGRLRRVDCRSTKLSPETTSEREGFLHPIYGHRRRGGSEAADPAAQLRHRGAGRAGRAVASGGHGQRAGLSRLGDRSAASSRSIETWPKGWPGNPARWNLPSGPWSGWAGTPRLTIVRGGTDGSRFTELGLAHSEPVDRSAPLAFEPRMGLPGGDGAGRRNARRAGADLGRRIVMLGRAGTRLLARKGRRLAKILAPTA